MKYLNKKGFVLLETLVVTIFTLIIFTLLYTSAVPLLGKYNDLAYYNDLDTTYDLFYLKRIIVKDANFSSIRNTSTGYKKIKCSDLVNSETCYDVLNLLNFDSNKDEIVYLKTDKLANLKNDNSISSGIKDYLNYVSTTGEILLLNKNNYLSYLKIEYNPTLDINPSCSVTISNNNSTSGITTTVTCNSNGGAACKSDNPTGDTNLKSSKTYRVYNTLGNSGTCSVNVRSQGQQSVCTKAVWGNTKTENGVSSCTAQSESNANAKLWNYVITCTASYSYSGTCSCMQEGQTRVVYVDCNSTVYGYGGCYKYCKYHSGGDVNKSTGTGTCSRKTTYKKVTKSRTGCSTWGAYTNTSSCTQDTNKIRCQTIYVGS